MLSQQLLLCIAFADVVGVEALLERFSAVAAAVDSFVRMAFADYYEEVYFPSDLSLCAVWLCCGVCLLCWVKLVNNLL